MNQRRCEVLESLLAETSPLANKPYIQDGTYQWYVEGPVELDFFFPEYPLAVKITGPCYGRYCNVEEFAPSRRFWEASVASDSFVIDVCQRAEVPLLLITPDDPVDVFSISLRLRSLLSRK